MAGLRKHFDAGALTIMALTVVLFLTALFVKGLGHDLLLEAGVFLVSAKLILMAYKSSVVADTQEERLARMESALMRLEALLRQAAANERPAP